MENNRKSFSVDVPEWVADKFEEQRDERGYTKWKAIKASLLAFLALPPAIQVALMGNSVEDVYQFLVEGLVDAELQKELEDLGPARDEFLRLLRQAKRSVSRKK